MKIKKKYFAYALIISIFVATLLYLGRLSHYYTGTYVMNYGVQRMAMLHRQAQQVEKCDILIIGDSLVEGMFLQSAEKSIFLMGVGGSKVEDWAVWAPHLLKNIQAQTLIIALGVNNTARNKDFDKNTLAHNFKKLCELATANGIPRIILSSVLPVGKSQVLGHNTFDSDAIKEINASLKALAQNSSYTYLDCYSHFVNDEGFMPDEFTIDGVHLNEKGYEIWKKLLLAAQ